MESEEPQASQESTNFPTSAAPIFKRVALLVAAIIGLCVLSYSCTDESAESPQVFSG